MDFLYTLIDHYPAITAFVISMLLASIPFVVTISRKDDVIIFNPDDVEMFTADEDEADVGKF